MILKNETVNGRWLCRPTSWSPITNLIWLEFEIGIDWSAVGYQEHGDCVAFFELVLTSIPVCAGACVNWWNVDPHFQKQRSHVTSVALLRCCQPVRYVRHSTYRVAISWVEQPPNARRLTGQIFCSFPSAFSCHRASKMDRCNNRACETIPPSFIVCWISKHASAFCLAMTIKENDDATSGWPRRKTRFIGSTNSHRINSMFRVDQHNSHSPFSSSPSLVFVGLIKRILTALNAILFQFDLLR